MLKNKRAQIGETITWTVATIIIIAALIVSLFISSQVAEKKELVVKGVELYHDAKNVFGNGERNYDLLLEKSIFSYFLISEGKGEVLGRLRTMENEGNFQVDMESRFSVVNGGLG